MKQYNDEIVENKINRKLKELEASIILAGGDIDIERLKQMAVKELFQISIRNGISIDFWSAKRN